MNLLVANYKIGDVIVHEFWFGTPPKLGLNFSCVF
jgi:hypothetical protein